MENLNDLFENALNEGDEEYIWNALNPNRPINPAAGSWSFSDPDFLREVERFIESNRLPMATAYSRFKLRRALSGLKEKNNIQPKREFTIPAV